MFKKRIIKMKQNGFVLALTLMCALVLTSVMMSTMFVSTKGMKVSKNLKESIQTLNAADAAVKKAKAAISTWLISQQVGTGVIVDFDTILSASAAAGKLVVSGNSTDWGNLTLLGNTVSITASDDEGASDSDRIFKLTATATSPSRQRVQIVVYVQAPYDGNTTGLPTILGASTFCNDFLGLTQVLRVRDSSTLDARNYGIPAFTCSGAACATSTSLTGSGNLPPAIMFNALRQMIVTEGGSTTTGSPTSEVITADDTNCNELYDYANQVSLLSDSLPYVNVIADETVSSAELGTRDNPTITIFNGSTRLTLRGILRKRTVIDANSKGSGIMMIQYDSDTSTDGAAIVGKNNLYYEGTAFVYGGEYAGFKLRGSNMYGAVVILSGSLDISLKERFAVRDGSVFKFSQAALDQSDKAMGNATAGLPVTSSSDPRNQLVNVGWAETYNSDG